MLRSPKAIAASDKPGCAPGKYWGQRKSIRCLCVMTSRSGSGVFSLTVRGGKAQADLSADTVDRSGRLGSEEEE